jgi:hypothetical protein
MNGPLEWFAAIGTMIAAGLIAADLGRRVTGWGFVLFVVVAISWVIAGTTSDPPAYPLAVMNGILLCINAWGVWQFLLNPKKRREIEIVERYAEKVHECIEAEDAPAPSPGDDQPASLPKAASPA